MAKINPKKTHKTVKKTVKKVSLLKSLPPSPSPIMGILVSTIGLLFLISLISDLIYPFTGGVGIISHFISNIFFATFGISSFIFVFISVFFTSYYFNPLSLRKTVLRSVYILLLVSTLGSIIGLFLQGTDNSTTSLMTGYVGLSLSNQLVSLFNWIGALVILLGVSLALILVTTEVEPKQFFKRLLSRMEKEEIKENSRREDIKPIEAFNKPLYEDNLTNEIPVPGKGTKGEWDSPAKKDEGLASQIKEKNEGKEEIKANGDPFKGMQDEDPFYFDIPKIENPSNKEILVGDDRKTTSLPELDDIPRLFQRKSLEPDIDVSNFFESEEMDEVPAIGWDEIEDLEEAATTKEVSLDKESSEGLNGESLSMSDEEEVSVYKLPSLSLLNDPPLNMQRPSIQELEELARVIEAKLADFSISCEVTNVIPGPVVSRFVVKLGVGVKVSRILALQDDLALAMRVQSLRILAPIPGRAAVGIEIPNIKPDIIYFKDIISDPGFLEDPDSLTLALGKTCSDKPFFTNLESMPHLLIAGATGTGKSVCINALIASLVYKFTPDKLRLIMIDPKVLELTIYDGIPHLLWPVITQPKEAMKLLQWTVDEMERRYSVLAHLRVRNILGFNQRIEKAIRDGKEIEGLNKDDMKTLPYIVIIIDEYADLKMTAGKEVEIPIARLAQKARAVGVHIILATQRPEVKIIGGTIKSNFPSRISFQVPSKYDSRTILDRIGAEKLLGNGDMFFLQAGRKDPHRIHGAFISDEEAERISVFLKEQKIQSVAQIGKVEMESAKGTDALQQDDDIRFGDNLFFEAAELILRHDQASASFLQRRMQIGYPRAAKIIDILEEEGIIGPASGSKKRECLITVDEFTFRYLNKK